MSRRVLAPSPRAHLDGTLALLADLAGGPLPDGARAFLDRPADLPASVRPEDAGLKYDVYTTARPGGSAWGFTSNDRWEPAAWAQALDSLLATHGVDRRLYDALRGALGAVPATTLGLGVDRPGAPPRFKLYLKEARWNDGLVDAARLRALLAPFELEVPDWLGDRPLGVVTVEAWPDGSAGVKLYPGGPDAASAAAGAPGVAGLLAAVPDRLPGWWYLTVRLRPGTAPRLALNKIYDVVQLALVDGADPAPAWEELDALFARAGQADALRRVRAAAEAPGRRVVPTAFAVEEEGRSVDVYLAAWAGEGITTAAPGRCR